MASLTRALARQVPPAVRAKGAAYYERGAVVHADVHQPTPVVTLDGPHLYAGKDCGACIRGGGKVIHHQRVLCRVIAAGHAVAAQHARFLLYAVRVDLRFERDRNLWAALEPFLGCRSGRLEETRDLQQFDIFRQPRN